MTAPAHRAALLAALVASPALLAAQVGYHPTESPYRDINAGVAILLGGGYLFGDGGQVGAAPHDGPTGSLQIAFLANRSLSIVAGFHYGSQERNIINPILPPETRVTGTATHGTIWMDAALHFNVTGGKHWHGLAPYAGAAIGLSFTETVQEDPADFAMGTKFTFTPLVGTRVFLGNSYLFAEGRFQFWQISYPASYLSSVGGRIPVIPTGVPKEWSVSPWVRVGLGLPWNWPF